MILYEPWVVESPRFARMLVPAVRKRDGKPVAVWLDKERTRGFYRTRDGRICVNYITDNARFYCENVECAEELVEPVPKSELSVFKTEARARNFSRYISDYNPDFGGFVPPVPIEQYYMYVKTNIHPELGVLD